MDWTALRLSIELALWTVALLIPLGVLSGRWLAFAQFRGKALIEAALALPLVLPPTVLGFYFLILFSNQGRFGQFIESLTGGSLVFSFQGLVIASVLFNLPFAVQPVQRAFEAIPRSLREAAWCSGMSRARTFSRIELPLAWPGILTGGALTFAHTLGEFGVVLMVGGNIPGETRTVSISIYDRVQAFDYAGAGVMAAVLLGISFLAILFVGILGGKFFNGPR
ncbi:MAG: molybdate ABC transporter permease subunit [Fimbriimonadaceae bacterium]|nr:molybdate ABC transporter permease subunit [Alphaproteobacteria bacterium]